MIKRLAICALVAMSVGWVARLEWKPNTERDFAGYVLWHGPLPGVYTGVMSLWKETNCGVEVETQQYFALQAYRSNGLSSPLTAELSTKKPLRIVTERSVDGVMWLPVATNDLSPSYSIEFFRLRIER